MKSIKIFQDLHTQFSISDIPNKSIGVPGARRRPLDINVHQFTVAAEYSLHLLVGDVELQVACGRGRDQRDMTKECDNK